MQKGEKSPMSSARAGEQHLGARLGIASPTGDYSCDVQFDSQICCTYFTYQMRLDVPLLVIIGSFGQKNYLAIERDELDQPPTFKSNTK